MAKRSKKPNEAKLITIEDEQSMYNYQKGLLSTSADN